MRITAVGKKAVSNTYVKADFQGLENIDDYRVLIGKAQTGTGGLCQYLSTRSHGVLQKMPLKRIVVMNAV